jgi:hypothetical protein
MPSGLRDTRGEWNGKPREKLMLSVSFVSSASFISQVRANPSRIFATLLLACCATPAARGQYTYGVYLEPPDGTILQGMGQYMDDNEDYMEALDGYDPAPLPGHKLTFVNITPTEDAGNDPHYFSTTKAANLLGHISGSAHSGQIPHINISFWDHTPDPGADYDPTAHDDEVNYNSPTAPVNPTNQAMENQITRLGEVLASYGGPVFVRIGGEFNNPDAVTNPKSRESYHEVAFPVCYRRTKALLEAAGATQTAYIWCWWAGAPDNYADTNQFGSPLWYPGDNFVDWFGLDIFHHNEFTTDSPSKLAEVEEFLELAECKGRPVFVAESSCTDFEIVEDSTDEGGAIIGWFDPYFDFIESHPIIKAITYISHDWDTDSSTPFTDWEDARIANNAEVMDNWVAELTLDPRYLHAGTTTLLNGYEGWFHLGHALAGAGGEPKLAGAGPVVADGPIVITLSDAAPNADTILIVGASRIDDAYKGGVLVPDTDLVISTFDTDGSGSIVIPTYWPTGVPSGFTVYYQFWIEDAGGPEDFSASNAIMGVTL